MTDADKLFEDSIDLDADQLFDSAEDLSAPKSMSSRMINTVQNVANSAIESGDAVNENLATPLIQNAMDTARGVGQGLVMGAGDEIGGALSAGVEALYNKFNSTDSDLRDQGFKIEEPGLADLYRQNQQAIQKENDISQERSPYLYGGGQIAGGVTSGSAIGGVLGIGKQAANAKSLAEIARNEGKLSALGSLLARGGKTYAQALPSIAVEGALSSREGGLEEGRRGQLAEDVVGSALFGLPAVMGLQAATDVAGPAMSAGFKSSKNFLSDMVEDTPLMRQMKVSYEYGKKGINPKSQSQMLNTDLGAANNLTQLDNQRSLDLMNEIYAAEKRVGQGVSDSLQNTTNTGKLVDIDLNAKQALASAQSLASKYPEIVSNPRADSIFKKIATNQTKITPLEAKDLIDYMDAYIGKFQSATNITPGERGILDSLIASRKQFSNTLKISVPEYAQAAERFHQFRKLVPETIIAGNRPVEIADTMFKEINDKKLFDQIKKLNQGTTRQGSAAQPIKESFVNTIKGLKTFEEQEAQRLARGEIQGAAFNKPASEIENAIKQNSDDAVARGAMDALEPHTGIANTMAKAVTGTGETGRAMSLTSANIAGRMVNKIGKSTQNNAISKVTRGIYNAPSETVLALSQKLKAEPSLAKYGMQLEDALNSPDQNRRNQALFVIMQNPTARAFVEDEQESQEPQN